MESLFERLLREKIALMMDMRVEAMTVTGLGSYDEYKHSLGYIEALRHILAALDETQTDMRKE
jgi:hypothetical protein